jgi:hypothetical protein
MPFGRRLDRGETVVDFEAVYHELVAPAIEGAGLEALRPDEEVTGGIMAQATFERLVLCEFAVADLTSANANVSYELGVRHAVRPSSTVLISAAGQRLMFEYAQEWALQYRLSPMGVPTDVEKTTRALAERLIVAREAPADSPLYQLVEGLSAPEVDRSTTDRFRDRVRDASEKKERLAAARAQNLGAVQEIERELGSVAEAEGGFVVDLFLSYRALGGWREMIELVGRMSPGLAATTMIQEQYALALNRVGESERAEQVLNDLLTNRGPSSETYGILGRVYKDRWAAAKKASDGPGAQRSLSDAVATYLKGFEADLGDAYPGVNAVTLMEVCDPPDPRREELVPVVRYALGRRLAGGTADYWDHATALELAVLAKDEEGAAVALGDALAAVREGWEPETTARNLGLIREARSARGERVDWANEVEQQLLDRARSAY